MSMTLEQLTERLQKFSDVSLHWCSKESEQATARVTDAIEMLMKNTKRVSSISQESLDALQGLRKQIHVQFGDDKTKKIPMAQLINSLELLSTEHNEIDSVIHPIISSLQFQDRMRQNFENMIKMLPIWLDYRDRNGAYIPADEVSNFARDLCKVTTMIAERDIVRMAIPGTPEETAVAPVLLF